MIEADEKKRIALAEWLDENQEDYLGMGFATGGVDVPYLKHKSLAADIIKWFDAYPASHSAATS